MGWALDADMSPVTNKDSVTLICTWRLGGVAAPVKRPGTAMVLPVDAASLRPPMHQACTAVMGACPSKPQSQVSTGRPYLGYLPDPCNRDTAGRHHVRLIEDLSGLLMQVAEQNRLAPPATPSHHLADEQVRLVMAQL